MKTKPVTAAVLAAVVLLVAACSSSSSTTTSPFRIDQAVCNACAGATYTPADCQAWGAEAGCESSVFVATVAGCANGCSFTHCTASQVRCGGAVDAGVDAGRPQACFQADTDSIGKGLFGSDPPCANPHKATINGSVRYTCPCGGTCPCGYQCGSIALSVGGTIGSVCAPV